MLKLVGYSSWGTFFVLFWGGVERKNLLLLKKQTPSMWWGACWVWWNCYGNEWG